MKISVVITVFKRPERLQKAITTVKNQTYKDYEIIIVDGSNSKEIEKISKSEGCVYLPVEPEYVDASFWKGIQHQRNIGCKIAKGEYIALLDDDDEWEPTKLEKQIKVFESVIKDHIGLVVCYSKIIDGKSVFIDKTKTQPIYEDLLKSFNWSSTSTYFFRKDILRLIGMWNEDLRGMHEYDLALKVVKNGYLIMCVQEPLVTRYRSFNKETRYYFIKIAEIFDFWKYYGEDIFDRLSFSETIMNMLKTLALLSIFSVGYFLKDKIWNFIYIMKISWKQGELVNEI